MAMARFLRCSHPYRPFRAIPLAVVIGHAHRVTSQLACETGMVWLADSKAFLPAKIAASFARYD